MSTSPQRRDDGRFSTPIHQPPRGFTFALQSAPASSSNVTPIPIPVPTTTMFDDILGGTAAIPFKANGDVSGATFSWMNETVTAEPPHRQAILDILSSITAGDPEYYSDDDEYADALGVPLDNLKVFHVRDTAEGASECTICLCGMSEQPTPECPWAGWSGATPLLTEMPGCGHVFHHVCLWRWLTTSTACPLCRREFSTPDGPN